MDRQSLVQKRYLFTPPLLKIIFFPFRNTLFFDSFCGLFALILPYFAFILHFYFPFLFSFLFSFPFLPFSFPFLPFRLLFSSHPLFIFFPLNDITWYSPPPGKGVFTLYRHLWKGLGLIKNLCEVLPFQTASVLKNVNTIFGARVNANSNHANNVVSHFLSIMIKGTRR
jgi:hypothetical protein